MTHVKQDVSAVSAKSVRELRLPCTPTGVLAHLDAFDEPVTGHIVEVSRAGFKLHMDNPLPVGSFVTVETGGMTMLGDVRYCYARSDQRHTVGIRTCDVKNSHCGAIRKPVFIN